jgi:probable F420-dependent oxidoreductase
VRDRMKFIAPMPRLTGEGSAWVAAVQRIAVLGFDTLAVSHHVTRGWQLGLVAAMAFAAASTSSLRVMSLVAQNDLQHPALLAKDLATIDVLSGGRVEVGLGAGWQASDYRALGLPFESSGRRIARLAEALEIMRTYFGKPVVDFKGEHYQVNMEALPRPVQNPRPPILVGAGGPRMLELAGRRADIVGVHPRMTGGSLDRTNLAELSGEAVDAKVATVRRAAADAGRLAPVLQFSCYHVRVTDGPGGDAPRSTWDDMVAAEAATLKDSPAVLVGTAAQCAEQLLTWRDRYGISYWNLGPDVESSSLIIDALDAAGELTALSA